MSHLKGPISVFIVALAAFYWGYKKDNIELSFASWFEESEEAAKVEAPSEKPAVERKARPDRRPKRGPGQAAASSKRTNMYGGKPPGWEFRNKDNTSKKSDTKRPFGGTLDSVRRGKVTDGQKASRNLYFKKLSEQMEQLRGEQPPKAEPKSEARPAPQGRPSSPSRRPNRRGPEKIEEPAKQEPPEALEAAEENLPEEIQEVEEALDVDELSELEAALDAIE